MTIPHVFHKGIFVHCQSKQRGKRGYQPPPHTPYPSKTSPSYHSQQRAPHSGNGTPFFPYFFPKFNPIVTSNFASAPFPFYHPKPCEDNIPQKRVFLQLNNSKPTYIKELCCWDLSWARKETGIAERISLQKDGLAFERLVSPNTNSGNDLKRCLPTHCSEQYK